MRRALGMLLAVAKKELRQTLRDRRMIALLIVAPAIQLFVFGFAVDFDVDRVPTVVVDLDDSRMSRGDIRRLAADGTLALIGCEHAVPDAERRLETGDAAVVLVIPEGFERDVVRERGATVQALVDGGDPTRANVAASTVAAYFAERSMDMVRVRVSRLAGLGMRPTALSVRSRVLFNPELRSAVYMVPGVAAILLMLITTVVTAMGLSRERERGTLEQILVTPVPSSLLILGKILPFAVIGLFDFILALAVGAYVFDMPLRGDFLVLFAATVFYLLITLGVGLIISASSGSQQQAFMGGFLFMLPAALLSGIMTPIHSMPDWLRPLTLINPVRHYAEVTRGTLLRSAGFTELSTELAILALMGVGVFAFATFRFRRSIG